MGYYPQESLYKPYKYHGYTVRGTPNCPLKKTESTTYNYYKSPHHTTATNLHHSKPGSGDFSKTPFRMVLHLVTNHRTSTFKIGNLLKIPAVFFCCGRYRPPNIHGFFNVWNMRGFFLIEKKVWGVPS